MFLRKMSSFFLTLAAWSLTWSSCSAISPVQSMKSKALSNKELRVTGDIFTPFWTIYCPDGRAKQVGVDCPTRGDMYYGGILWELLVIMQRTRNVTFTFIHDDEYNWGYCHSNTNCTGMVGMVNRGEVDFAIGKGLKNAFIGWSIKIVLFILFS